MSSTPYTRFFWSDWIADTAHLDLMQTGAYLRLLEYIYQHQRPIPGDFDKIYRIARAYSPTEQQSLRAILQEYFEDFLDPEEGRVYRHFRAEREIKWSNRQHADAVENGRRGAEIRWRNKNKDLDSHPNSHPSGDPNSNQNQNQNQKKERKEREDKERKKRSQFTFAPPSVTDVQIYSKTKMLDVDAEGFVDHFTSNGWKVGGKAPMKDWRAAVRNWHRRNGKNKPGQNEPTMARKTAL